MARFRIVELILSHLLDPVKDNANISGLLSEFNRSALGYVLDQHVCGMPFAMSGPS
jgi:hypothetical protein